MNIGERQTVQHAKHPTLGKGRLVYDNGPAFFIADSGEIERYDEAGWAGSGVDGSRAYGQNGAVRVELNTTDRKCGPHHERIVTRDGRAGWLVTWMDDVSKRERFFWDRFEPDDGGDPIVMMNTGWWLGEPKHKDARASKVPIEARKPWVTKESVGGHHFTFRRESDPAPPEKPARKKTEQAEMFK